MLQGQAVAHLSCKRQRCCLRLTHGWPYLLLPSLQVKFGTSTRDKEAKVFISVEHEKGSYGTCRWAFRHCVVGQAAGVGSAAIAETTISLPLMTTSVQWVQ